MNTLKAIWRWPTDPATHVVVDMAGASVATGLAVALFLAHLDLAAVAAALAAAWSLGEGFYYARQVDRAEPADTVDVEAPALPGKPSRVLTGAPRWAITAGQEVAR